GSAMDIQLLEGHVEHPVEQDVVDRERLVVFRKVEVAYREPGFVQDLLDSRDRSLRKAPGLAGRPRGAKQPRNGLEAVRTNGIATREDQRRRAVADLTGVSRREHSILSKGWTQLRQLFGRCIWSHPFVHREGSGFAALRKLDGDDLITEISCRGASMRLRRDVIQHLS